MRAGILPLVVVLSVTPAIALAERVVQPEATLYVGIDPFGNQIGLGDSTSAEQRPQTAPTIGTRFTYIALRSQRDVRVDFGGELELSFTPSSTGASEERPSVDARCSAIARC